MKFEIKEVDKGFEPFTLSIQVNTEQDVADLICAFSATQIIVGHDEYPVYEHLKEIADKLGSKI